MKRIIGYRLIKTKYKAVAEMIARESVDGIMSVSSLAVLHLRDADVLESWCSPEYYSDKNLFMIGDVFYLTKLYSINIGDWIVSNGMVGQSTYSGVGYVVLASSDSSIGYNLGFRCSLSSDESQLGLIEYVLANKDRDASPNEHLAAYKRSIRKNSWEVEYKIRYYVNTPVYVITNRK